MWSEYDKELIDKPTPGTFAVYSVNELLSSPLNA